MVRTQLYLDDRAHARLHELARQQGRTISDLVREAIDRVYLAHGNDDLLSAFDKVVGIWSDRKDLGSTRAYVRRLRTSTGRKKRLGL